METIAVPWTLDEAIADRLAYIEEVERQREIARQQEAARIEAAKLEFAGALAVKVLAIFGIDLGVEWFAGNITEEYSRFKFDREIDANPMVGMEVSASVATRFPLGLNEVIEADYVDWRGYRAWRKPGRDDGPINGFEDATRIDTTDFVEAVTYAKTGKR